MFGKLALNRVSASGTTGAPSSAPTPAWLSIPSARPGLIALGDWTAEPGSSLTLLILLDQLTRNMFRTPNAFSSDAKAAAIATKAIAQDFDKQVTRYQALQFYLPLMRQESLLAQVASLSLLENLRASAGDDAGESPFLDKSINSSRLHLAVIPQFGRCPNRNAILEQESTAAELEFLNTYLVFSR